MDKSTEKSFLSKIYVIIILIFAILSVLLYLVLSGGSERLQRAMDAQSESHHEPTSSPVPSASSDPRDTSSPEPTEDPSASEEPTPSPSPTPTPTPTPEVPADDIDSNDSLTRIVSPERKIDPSYVPANLVEPNVPLILDENQNLMRADAAAALETMFAAAEQEGHHLYLISGYRSYEFQKDLQKYWIDKKGKKYAAELDSTPGGSEHQLGLAANIGTVDGKCALNVCFADTSAYQWLIANAWKYGYIERYPSGKQEITGITYSPWNFRYVGTDAAKRIYDSGKTMEEYYGLAS